MKNENAYKQEKNENRGPLKDEEPLNTLKFLVGNQF